MAAILNLVCDSIMFMDLQNLQFATKIKLLVENNQRYNQNKLYSLILELIPYFDSVDPVLI